MEFFRLGKACGVGTLGGAREIAFQSPTRRVAERGALPVHVTAVTTMMIMTMIMATTRRSEPAAPSQLPPMQPPTPPFGCVRKYDSALAVSSARRQYEQDVVRAFRAEHGALAVGNASLASALSLNEIRRRGSAQKRHFLRRFSSVGRAAPVPGLSIGCAVADAACSVAEAHSYSNAMQDLSLHSHFFRGQRNGVYVEIGGMDGVGASNTLFFEQHLNWTGT